MSRTPIIAGNWKMNTTTSQAVSLLDEMIEDLEVMDGVEIVLCPPFISLALFPDLLSFTSIGLGAQNMFWEESGAYTGEVSPLMLSPLCNYVMLGHSERRAYFGETDQDVKRKVVAALKHDLRPIICVGENLADYEAGRSHQIVERQVRSAFDGLSAPDALRCVVAYEPIWAIGTGRPATGAGAEEVISGIRRLLAAMHGPEVAAQVRLQYGGSVTSANVEEFLVQPDVDGALVGGASLKPDEFVRICATAERVKR